MRARKDGFRERGTQVTRLETFVDAAFAFAVTLLVVSAGELPSSSAELVETMKGTPAFVASFVLLAFFWWSHNGWSRRYGLDDTPSNLLSLTLVALVLIYVYPLRALSESFFGWVSGGWFPARYQIASVADLRTMFALYGVLFATVGLTLAALHRRAWKLRDALELDDFERAETLSWIAGHLFVAASGTLSFFLALLVVRPGVPSALFAIPGLAYFLLFLTGPLSKVVVRSAQQER